MQFCFTDNLACPAHHPVFGGSGGTRTPKPLRPDLQSGEPTNCSTLPFLILYWTRTNLCGITAVLPLDEQKSFTCFGLQPSSFKLCYRRTIENCSSLFPPPNIVAPCRLELQPRVCNTPTLPLRHGAINYQYVKQHVQT